MFLTQNVRYTIAAKAYDAAGNTAISTSAVNFSINNRTLNKKLYLLLTILGILFTHVDAIVPPCRNPRLGLDQRAHNNCYILAPAR